MQYGDKPFFEQVPAGGKQVVNLIFDLGNVLVRWDPVAIARSVVAGPGAVRLAEHLFAHPDWQEVDRGSLSLDEVIARAVERTDVDEPIVRGVYEAVASSLITIPESFALAQELKNKGHTLYALSNMGHVCADYLQAHAPFWSLFKDVVISARVGLLKPEPAIFAHMLTQFGLSADDCLFFDDTLANVEAARSCGIQAIHFTDAKLCRDELESLGFL